MRQFRDKAMTDFVANIKRETPLAYLVNDGIMECWIPKSQVEEIEVEEKGVDGDDLMRFTIPEWLAIEKGIV